MKKNKKKSSSVAHLKNKYYKPAEIILVKCVNILSFFAVFNFLCVLFLLCSEFHDDDKRHETYVC